MTASVPANQRDSVNAELHRLLDCGPDTFSIPMENNSGRIVRYATIWQMTATEKAIFKQSIQAAGRGGDLKEDESIASHGNRNGRLDTVRNLAKRRQRQL